MEKTPAAKVETKFEAPKVDVPKLEAPKVEFPKFPAAKFNFDALVNLQKANVETMLAAHKIMFDLVQTVAKRQADLMKELVGKAEASMKTGFDSKKQPAAYVDDAKAALEKAMADAKETLDLGLRAQNEVVDLFVKRATANFDQVKALAA
jgi:hypothetical protein